MALANVECKIVVSEVPDVISGEAAAFQNTANRSGACFVAGLPHNNKLMALLLRDNNATPFDFTGIAKKPAFASGGDPVDNFNIQNAFLEGDADSMGNKVTEILNGLTGTITGAEMVPYSPTKAVLSVSNDQGGGSVTYDSRFMIARVDQLNEKHEEQVRAFIAAASNLDAVLLTQIDIDHVAILVITH